MNISVINKESGSSIWSDFGSQIKWMIWMSFPHLWNIFNTKKKRTICEIKWQSDKIGEFFPTKTSFKYYPNSYFSQQILFVQRMFIFSFLFHFLFEFLSLLQRKKIDEFISNIKSGLSPIKRERKNGTVVKDQSQ